MTDIREMTEYCIERIKNTKEYKDYLESRERVRSAPHLEERLNQYRAKNYELQMNASDGLLDDALEQLAKEYKEVQEDVRASDFLEAELALCRLLQEFQVALVAGIDFE